jgi:hypothetical protein
MSRKIIGPNGFTMTGLRTLRGIRSRPKRRRLWYRAIAINNCYRRTPRQKG